MIPSVVTMTLTGVVRGNTIVLDSDPNLPDGARVSVEIKPMRPAHNPFWGSWREEAELLRFLPEGARQRGASLLGKIARGTGVDR